MAKSQKTEERRRKKMFFMIFMILFVGIVLTASTYAWFTTNSNVEVNSLDVNVAASDGLQISVNAEEWNPAVKIADLIGEKSNWTGNTNQLPGAGAESVPLQPVSTNGGVVGARLPMFRGKLADDGTGTFTLTADASGEDRRTDGGDFVAFDIFFQVPNAKMLYLATGSGITTSSDTGIKNASRVAFLVQGNAPYGTAKETIQNLNAATSAWIWEPNYDTHSAAGYSNATDTYKIDSSLFSKTADGYTSSKLDYYGLKAAIPSTSPQSITGHASEYFGDSTVTTHVTPAVPGIPSNAYQELFMLEEGITKVRVYMWFEGQDVDCEDKASGGQVTLDLKFSINDKA